MIDPFIGGKEAPRREKPILFFCRNRALYSRREAYAKKK